MTEQWLSALGLSAIVAALAAPGVHADELRIGFLAPVTGSLAQIATDMTNGFRMYLDDHKGNFNGAKVEFIIGDTQAKPAVAGTRPRGMRVDVRTPPHRQTGWTCKMLDCSHSGGVSRSEAFRARRGTQVPARRETGEKRFLPGLALGEASDPSGGSLALVGTKVAVMGRYVPLVSASGAKVVFVCPAGGAAPMSISLETGDSRSVRASVASRESAPGILTVDSSYNRIDGSR